MWTPTTRQHHSRRAPRYQTDLTDEEWRVIEPHLPPARATGRPRAWPMREIVNAIFYVLRGGMAWRLLPSDFPPWSTIYRADEVVKLVSHRVARHGRCSVPPLVWSTVPFRIPEMPPPANRPGTCPMHE